jgi:type VI secretion system protein ImpC
MPKPSFDRADVHLTAGQPEPAAQPTADEETPMRIALLGDFSARRQRPSASFAERGPIRVDRDNYEQVLAGLGASLQLSLGDGAAPVALRFSEMDDFLPDRLFQRLEIFQALRELRRDLRNPKTFAQAAARMGSGTTQAAPSAQAAPPPSSSSEGDDLLDQLLAQTEETARPPQRSSVAGQVQALLRTIVGPHLQPRIDPSKQAELEDAVDQAATKEMRAILHHPDFQALEAAWRTLDFLVRRLDTDPQMQMYLWDVSKEELAADLEESADLRQATLYRVFVEETVETPGGVPWGLLCGLYRFDASRSDVETLGRLANIAQRGGAPFLAEAESRVLGCASIAQTPDPKDWRLDAETERFWEALRRLPAATSLGLALPRFLLRLPYGQGALPVDAFAFEEMGEKPGHDDYLWGNPAALCISLFGQAFSRYGWKLRSGVSQDVGDLPTHVYREGGESRVKPCAEVLLTQRAAGAILDKGLMTLLSVRDRDVIKVARFQSVASQPLAGRWS